MKNIMSTSECSSGCESGWTMYLDQSVNPGYDEKGGGHSNGKWSMEKDEEDEDHLSMVSDASSGPRQKCHQEDQNNNYDVSQTTKSPRSSKVRLNEKKRCDDDVDDTASSSTSFTCISKKKSGSLKKGLSVDKKCVSNKSGEMRKGCAQGSRELGSARKN